MVWCREWGALQLATGQGDTVHCSGGKREGNYRQRRKRRESLSEKKGNIIKAEREGSENEIIKETD